LLIAMTEGSYYAIIQMQIADYWTKSLKAST